MAAALVAGVDRVFWLAVHRQLRLWHMVPKPCQKVDKIVGPGNIFVATAKKHLYGTVDIDMIAGPSEILIVADETANPKYLAADLMSQAEHDVLASAILLTTSSKIAEETIAQIYEQVECLERKDIINKSLDDFGAVIVCDTMDEAIEFANDLAPEHLRFALQIRWNISAVWTMPVLCSLEIILPEPLGDYYAGPNHVCQPAEPQDFSRRCPLTALLKNPASFITQDALKAAKMILLL